MPPAELVAPTVAYLGHEACEVNGLDIEVAAGMTRYRFFAETPGYFNRDVTLEDVRDNFGTVLDTSDHKLVAEPLDNPMSEIIQRKPYVPA